MSPSGDIAAADDAQFTVNGDRNLLATAEAGVGRILQHAAEPPPKELWDSPIPPDEANFGLEVLSYLHP